MIQVCNCFYYYSSLNTIDYSSLLLIEEAAIYCPVENSSQCDTYSIQVLRIFFVHMLFVFLSSRHPNQSTVQATKPSLSSLSLPCLSSIESAQSQKIRISGYFSL